MLAAIKDGLLFYYIVEASNIKEAKAIMLLDARGASQFLFVPKESFFISVTANEQVRLYLDLAMTEPLYKVWAEGKMYMGSINSIALTGFYDAKGNPYRRVVTGKKMDVPISEILPHELIEKMNNAAGFDVSRLPLTLYNTRGDRSRVDSVVDEDRPIIRKMMIRLRHEVPNRALQSTASRS